MVRTTRNYRETKMNYMTHSRYLIHWEPDWVWRGTTDEFLQMYKDASEVIRKEDPSGLLLGANYGVLANAVPRMRELFEKGLAQYIRGVAVHLYFLPVSSLPEDKNLHGNCREMRRLVDRYLGSGAPLMNTEWGACVEKTLLVDHPVLVSHMMRFIRGHLIALGEGFDTTYFFYSTDYNFINYPENGEHGYGMTFNLSWTNFGGLNCQPKPTYMAAAAMTRLLEGTRSLGRLDWLDPELFVYSFRRGNENLLAAWSPHETRELRLRTGTGKVTVYDVMGNANEVATPDETLSIRVGRIPVYIQGISDKALATAPRTADAVFRAPHAELQSDAALAELLTDSGKKGGFSFRFSSDGRRPVVAENGVLPPDTGFGPRLLEAFDKDGRCLESMLVEIVSPLQISDITETVETDGRLLAQVHITNRSDKAGNASLQLTYAENPVEVKQIVLKPHESARIPFDVTHLYKGRPLADLSAAAFRTQGLENEFIRSNWGVASASKCRPVIDGKLDDWPAENFSPYLGRECLTKLKDWKGNQDFSVRYQIAADSRGISAAIEVRDDVDYFRADPDKPWRADSIMFAIGKESDRRGGWERIHFFSVSRDQDGKTALNSLIGLPPNQKLSRIDGKDAKAAVLRNENEKTTVYEVFIPWEIVDGKVSEFGFGASIFDADSKENVDSDNHREIFLMGGVPFFMSNALMSTVKVE